MIHSVVFIGGPWDMHKVAMTDIPPRFDVMQVADLVTKESYEPALCTIGRSTYRHHSVPDFATFGVHHLYIYEGTTKWH